MSSVATTYESVLKFWFPDEKTNDEKRKLWYFGGPDTDKLIKDKFGSLVLQARNGELAHWENLSEGVSAGLAFIILIDQFCRNIYRGTPNQFSHDEKALSVALNIIESGQDKELPFFHRTFIYLTLEHNENLERQKQCVKLFTDLAAEAEAAGSADAAVLKFSLKFAEEHFQVISQYGRFPRRNVSMGRESTPDEIEALKNWPYKF